MSTVSKLLETWQRYYNDPKMRKKIHRELEGEDYFNDTSGGYVRDMMEDRYNLEEMDAKEKAEAEEEIIEEWITERRSDFESEFESVANETDGMLQANRCIGVEDAEEFMFFVANETPLPEYNGLGIYWSWNKEDAECHWGKAGETVYVHALIPFDSIDPYVMLMQNLRPSTGEDESEVYVKEGSKIFVTEVELSRGSSYQDMVDEKVTAPHPIPMTASTQPYRYRYALKVLLEEDANFY